MDFYKFHSIENSYREKLINKILEHHCSNDDNPWCVTEKIHGANFSFTTDGQEVIAGKRTSFLKTKQERDWFMKSDYIYEKYKDNVLDLFNYFKDAKQLVIYGELFGGLYHCKGVSKIKEFPTIQKGVQYSPEHQFRAYDIAVIDKDNNKSYVNYKIAIDTFKTCKIPYLDILYSGSFKECLDWSKQHYEDKTTIPEQLDLPEIENNVREGHVLKPIEPAKLSSGESIVLKHKNDKFKEVQNSKNKNKVSDKVRKFIDLCLCYVTEQRLDNVLSKFGELDSKSIGKVIGLFSKDVFEDFRKDVEKYDELETKEKKHVRKSVNTECSKLIMKRL